MKLQKRLLTYLCILFVATLYSTGCATKKDIKPAGESTAAAQDQAEPREQPAADAVPSLNSITLDHDAEQSTVTIETSVSPTYTIFKLTNPHRIIVDLPEINNDTSGGSSDLTNAYISAINTASIMDENKSFLRTEIILNNDLDYNAVSEGNYIVITFNTSGVEKVEPAPTLAEAPVEDEEPVQAEEQMSSPEPQQNALQDIQFTTTPEATIVSLIADIPIDKYHSYTLEQPNRLVIDLPKTTNGMNGKSLTPQSDMIKAIRTGTQPDKTRIVLDLAGDSFPLYQIKNNENSVDIHFASITSEIKQEETSEHEQESQPREAAEEAREETAEAEPAPPAEEIEQEKPVEKISFDFKDADIKNVLRLISDISGMNMIVSDSVQAKITLRLEDIPWTEALDIILDTNGLGKIVTGKITRIETREKIKKINEEKLLAKKSQEEVEDLVVKTFNISYAKASDMANFLKQMRVLSDRGSVTSFKLTNNITVQDIASNMEKVGQLIREQDIPTKQVMIEARVVQSNPSYVKELGIRWGGRYNTTHSGDPINLGGAAGDDYLVNLPAAAGEGAGGGINFGYIKDNLQLNVQLTALENEDKLKIVSNPRIIGLDNKEARIKQGVALPYLKLSEEGVTSTEFKDAVLELQVTPKITPANTIALHLYVTKNQKSSQTGAGNEPGIDVREVETDLLVKSGETVVIGGIYETQKTLNIKKVPFFADIPYLGLAFRSEKEEEQLTELLVFVTVTVVDNPALMAHN